MRCRSREAYLRCSALWTWITWFRHRYDELLRGDPDRLDDVAHGVVPREPVVEEVSQQWWLRPEHEIRGQESELDAEVAHVGTHNPRDRHLEDTGAKKADGTVVAVSQDVPAFKGDDLDPRQTRADDEAEHAPKPFVSTRAAQYLEVDIGRADGELGEALLPRERDGRRLPQRQTQQSTRVLRVKVLRDHDPLLDHVDLVPHYPPQIDDADGPRPRTDEGDLRDCHHLRHVRLAAGREVALHRSCPRCLALGLRLLRIGPPCLEGRLVHALSRLGPGTP